MSTIPHIVGALSALSLYRSFACCFNCLAHMCNCPSEFGNHYYLVIIHHPREWLKKETRQSVSSKYRQHPGRGRWKREKSKTFAMVIGKQHESEIVRLWRKSKKAQSVWKTSSVTSTDVNEECTWALLSKAVCNRYKC